jgi:hypothetical protein
MDSNCTISILSHSYCNLQVSNSNKLILQATDSKAKYNITFNDRVVAEVLMEVDGFYYIYFTGTGAWEAYHLKQIVQIVIELNRPYEEELKAYFDKQQSGFKNQEIDIDW